MLGSLRKRDQANAKAGCSPFFKNVPAAPQSPRPRSAARPDRGRYFQSPSKSKLAAFVYLAV